MAFTDDNTGLDEQAQEVRGRGGGAHMAVHDTRVSRALGWFWGLVGTFIAGSILLAANNPYQLNVTVARGIDSNIIRDARLDDHESRLRQVEAQKPLAPRNLSAVPVAVAPQKRVTK